MTTALQAAANVRNGFLSKGPTSPEGKATSAKNALRHGLSALAPVLPGERIEDWELHRRRIFESLAPVGALEEVMADRVALGCWRLRRVAAYETTVTIVGVEEVEKDVCDDAVRYAESDPKTETEPPASLLEWTLEQLEKERQKVWDKEWPVGFLDVLPDLADTDDVHGSRVEGLLECVARRLPGKPALNLKDPPFMAGLGVPKEELADPYEWNGWTAGMARKAVAHIAARCGLEPARLLEAVHRKEAEALEDLRKEVRSWERAAKQRRREVKVCEDRLRRRRMLPDDKSLDKVIRYESHLNRQIQQSLHTLERLQAARAGRDVPPPVALDITVDVDASSVA
jgi:hypothetical protein